MMRWFPPLLGAMLVISPLGCRQYRENWCQEHGFVHANQVPQAAPPPQVYAQPQVYAAPVAPINYAPGYGAQQYCAPAPTACPPGTVPARYP